MDNTRADLLLTIARQQVTINDLVKSRDELLEACKFAQAQIKSGSPKKALPILFAAIANAEKTASKPAEKAIDAEDEEYTLDNREGQAKPTKG